MSSATTGARVDLQNLRKEYGDLVAVDNVSLSVEPGEFVTFLGPSGSGKTTTLNMIAGFAQTTAGTVTVGDEDITNRSPHNRHIGMVFQSYALFPNLTVRGNIAFPLRQKNNRIPKNEIDSRVNRALEMVDLTHLAGRKPRALSGGQQQRVALARALVFSPRLLLLDEPLAALDKRLRERLQNEMRAIHKDLGVTFILVTHDQTEAMSLSDRIVVFNHGAVVQVGTPQELYLHPQSKFVAEFLGDSNLFTATVAEQGTAAVLTSTGQAIAISQTAVADNNEVLLIVRPEHMTLTFGTDIASAQNTIRGTVRSVVFEGANYRVEIDSEVGTSLLVLHPTAAGTEPFEGDTVTIGWNADQTHAFEDSSST